MDYAVALFTDQKKNETVQILHKNFTAATVYEIHTKAWLGMLK